MKYHFSFILLKAFVERIFFWCKRRENFNKFFAADSRLNDAFSTRKKNLCPFNKENTQKNLLRFRRNPFVKSDETFLSRFFFGEEK